MKANEFIREFGLEVAIEKFRGFRYDGITHVCPWYVRVTDFRKEELGTLIESHNIINVFGGLFFAENELKCAQEKLKSYLISDVEKVSLKFYVDGLIQAIKDVESCQ